jgi:hypothetical protein
MITLHKLVKQFPNHYIINRYTKQLNENWAEGRYYLGGQVPLHLDDNITADILLDVSHILFVQPIDAANSCEMASIQRAQSDFIEFQDLIETYKRVVRFNGIFRALIFWIIPARKRASEKVFHPSNLEINNDGNLVIKK